MFYTIFKITTLLIFICLITELIIYFYPIESKEYPIFNKNFSKKIFKKWDYISLPLYFLYMIIISFIIYIIIYCILVFIHKNNINNSLNANNIYFFTFPSILLGIIIAILPTKLTLKIFLKNKYTEYILHNKLMHKFSYNKYIKYFKLSIILICLIITILGFNWYIYYDSTSLKINNFLDLKSYNLNYNEINKIYLIRNTKKLNGNYTYKKHYLLKLNNGDHINTNNTLLDNNTFEKKILPLIKKNNHIKIKIIESIDDIKHQ